MDEELKACPFCSCTDIGEVTINPRLEPRHRRFKVYCKACQCRTSDHKTRKEARIYWNTRAQVGQGGEAVEVVGYMDTSDRLWADTTRPELMFPLMTVAQHNRIHPADQVAKPDAELVRQCIAQELATWEGDFKGPVHTAMRCLQVRIDAKLASLK